MKMKYGLFLSTCLLLLLWQACEAPNKKVVEGPEIIDIESFLNTQYEELAARDSLLKKAIINDSVEVHKVAYTKEEWKKELRFFSKSNINRKSWVDYFTIDSSKLKNGGLQISYTTNEEKVPVKETIVRQNKEGEINFIALSIHRSNPISELNRHLVYAFPDSIIIRNSERLWLVDDQNIKLIYRWED